MKNEECASALGDMTPSAELKRLAFFLLHSHSEF
jgi:hypothetical protein